MRVAVLGHRGMLGHAVARYLDEAGAEVLTLEERFSVQSTKRFVEAVNALRPAWCVNCVGIGPGRRASLEQMREANVELPRACVAGLAGGVQFLHASTDGVFAADKPDRSSGEQPDAGDEYGLSKIAAEEAVKAGNGWIIRCSIIGPELSGARSLMQWLLGQSGTVRGYTNKMWNGITTLEWAKTAWHIMQGVHTARLIQPACAPPVTKCELLRMIVREWRLPLQVEEAEGAVTVTRTLAPNIPARGLPELLRELHVWQGRMAV